MLSALHTFPTVFDNPNILRLAAMAYYTYVPGKGIEEVKEKKEDEKPRSNTYTYVPNFPAPAPTPAPAPAPAPQLLYTQSYGYAYPAYVRSLRSISGLA